jgi:hypothetical protein
LIILIINAHAFNGLPPISYLRPEKNREKSLATDLLQMVQKTNIK